MTANKTLIEGTLLTTKALAVNDQTIAVNFVEEKKICWELKLFESWEVNGRSPPADMPRLSMVTYKVAENRQ